MRVETVPYGRNLELSKKACLINSLGIGFLTVAQLDKKGHSGCDNYLLSRFWPQIALDFGDCLIDLVEQMVFRATSRLIPKRFLPVAALARPPPSSAYRGTSLIRNSRPLGPYSETMPRALWWS